MTVCWAESKQKAVDTVHRLWPNSGLPGELTQALPTPAHFEQASRLVTKEKIAESMPCGPDVEPFIQHIKAFAEAGFDHIYLHQIGPDQEGFFRFFQEEIQPEFQ